MQSLLIAASLVTLFAVTDCRMRPVYDDYRNYDLEDPSSDLALPDDSNPMMFNDRLNGYAGLSPLFSRLRRDAPQKYCGDQLVKMVKARCLLKSGRRKRSAESLFFVGKRSDLVTKCCKESCTIADIDASCP